MAITVVTTWGSVDSLVNTASQATVDAFLVELVKAGKMPTSLGTPANVTVVTDSGDTFTRTANVSLTFNDIDAANSYISFIANLNPLSTTIVS